MKRGHTAVYGAAAEEEEICGPGGLVSRIYCGLGQRSGTMCEA